MGLHQVSTTVRVVVPDGSISEIRADDEGRVVVSDIGADGLENERLVSEFTEAGVFYRTLQKGDGPAEPFEPVTETKRINSYGATVEHVEYADGLSADKSFDDDGHLRSTEVTAAWGSLVMRVRADGGRTLAWETAFHEGSRIWNAGGIEVSYEVDFADGSSHRREMIDDMVRVSHVDRHGRSEVSQIPVPAGG